MRSKEAALRREWQTENKAAGGARVARKYRHSCARTISDRLQAATRADGHAGEREAKLDRGGLRRGSLTGSERKSPFRRRFIFSLPYCARAVPRRSDACERARRDDVGKKFHHNHRSPHHTPESSVALTLAAASPTPVWPGWCKQKPSWRSSGSSCRQCRRHLHLTFRACGRGTCYTLQGTSRSGTLRPRSCTRARLARITLSKRLLISPSSSVSS